MKPVDYGEIFPHGETALSGPGPLRFRGFTITLRHITPVPHNTQYSQGTGIHAPATRIRNVVENQR